MVFWQKGNRMSAWWRLGLALSLMLASQVLWAAGGDTLEAIHVRHSGATTTVRFRLRHAPSYHYFALGHPPRAVVDFDDTRAAGVGSVSGGAVKGVRIGQHGKHTLRTVLDLTAGATLAHVGLHGDDLIAMIRGGRDVAPATGHGAPKAQHRAAKTRGADGKSKSASASGGHGEPQALYRAAANTGPIVVVIDPGHGGRDPGTHAADGLKEKTVNLAIAKALYAKFKATANIHPVLTRSSDTYVTLRQRVRIAQAHHANLFISIHQNAYPDNTSVRGGTCYMLSEHGASDAKAAQLAHFENSRDRSLAGVHFSQDHTLNAVLTDLYQNASIEDASDLADDIIRNFSKVEPIYRSTPPRANFAVLRDPMVPSVLCETAFLSNPHQARLLATRHFRDEIANAIYQAVMKYFRAHPPERMQAVGGSIYTVKAGDTLSGIAARQGVSENVIMDINHLHTKRLKPGQKLELPGGS